MSKAWLREEDEKLFRLDAKGIYSFKEIARLLGRSIDSLRYRIRFHRAKYSQWLDRAIVAFG